MELHAGHDRHHEVAQDDVEALAAGDSRERRGRAGDDHYLVIGPEEPAHGAADDLLVVDDQDPTPVIRAGNRGRSNGRLRLRAGHLKDHAKDRAATELARNGDHAAELGDDPMADGQAEPGAHSLRLRREERREELLHDLGRNTRPGVGNLDDDPLRAVGGGANTNLVGVRAALGDGLGRIDDEVQKDLAEARLVGKNEGNLAVILDQPRPMPDLVPGHPER